MLLHYPVSRGKTMNVIGIAVQPAWQDEGCAIPTEPAEFQAQFVEFHPDARALLAAVPEGALFKLGLRDRDPLPNWVRSEEQHSELQSILRLTYALFRLKNQ